MSASRVLVITVSDRAARGVYTDRSGPLLVAGLRSIGLEVTGPVVVPDGEVTTAILYRPVPGIAELLRASGAAQGVPAAVLSRGVAGVVQRTLR